jgi:hypothetical protein
MRGAGASSADFLCDRRRGCDLRGFSWRSEVRVRLAQIFCAISGAAATSAEFGCDQQHGRDFRGFSVGSAVQARAPRILGAMGGASAASAHFWRDRGRGRGFRSFSVRSAALARLPRIFRAISGAGAKLAGLLRRVCRWGGIRDAVVTSALLLRQTWARCGTGAASARRDAPAREGRGERDFGVVFTGPARRARARGIRREDGHAPAHTAALPRKLAHARAVQQLVPPGAPPVGGVGGDLENRATSTSCRLGAPPRSA